MATFLADCRGCKVSFADVEGIRERLAAAGHVERDARGAADVAVVGTCCVTGAAVRKSRQAVLRAARRAGRVFVTGCGARLENAFSGMPPHVRVLPLVGEEAAHGIARRVAAAGTGGEGRRVRGRVRAFLKIQDGCSFGCTYCVIPHVRGPSRSRPRESIEAEARRRIAEGYREIVLTGINVGCYRDRLSGSGLPELIRSLGALPGLARLRLSSVEVNHVGEGLLAAARETPTFCPHLHVPLQSGDDAVLRAMGRGYTADVFLRRVGQARGFQITTDAIVGFPVEDDRAFRRTMDVVAEAGITKVHVFPYSPRPGTEAVRGSRDAWPPEVKRARSRRLRAVSRAACRARWTSKIGVEDEVLVDRPGRGYGRDYSPWLVDGEPGEIVRARGRAVVEDGIVGDAR